MKRIITITIILSCLAFSFLISSENQIIDMLRAKSNANSILVEWHTKNETNIEKFEIERRSSENIFKTIATEKAKGYSTNYSYRDSDCFYKNSQSNELLEQANISYRLKIIFSNNTHVYSDEAIVTQNMSSVKRTWGMIKEMFK